MWKPSWWQMRRSVRAAAPAQLLTKASGCLTRRWGWCRIVGWWWTSLGRWAGLRRSLDGGTVSARGRVMERGARGRDSGDEVTVVSATADVKSGVLEGGRVARRWSGDGRYGGHWRCRSGADEKRAESVGLEQT